MYKEQKARQERAAALRGEGASLPLRYRQVLSKREDRRDANSKRTLCGDPASPLLAQQGAAANPPAKPPTLPPPPESAPAAPAVPRRPPQDSDLASELMSLVASMKPNRPVAPVDPPPGSGGPAPGTEDLETPGRYRDPTAAALAADFPEPPAASSSSRPLVSYDPPSAPHTVPRAAPRGHGHLNITLTLTLRSLIVNPTWMGGRGHRDTVVSIRRKKGGAPLGGEGEESPTGNEEGGAASRWKLEVDDDSSGPF